MNARTNAAWSLLLALALPGAALAETANHDEVPANWLGGSIVSNRTLTAAAPGPDYVVYGDVIVQPGVTLTIEPGVTLAFIDDSDFFAGGAYFGLSELIVRGTLTAVGTTTDSIVFRSQSGAAGHWGEIRVETGQATLSFVRIKGGVNALTLVSPATASVTRATVDGGVSSSGSLVLASSLVTGGITATYGSSQITDTEVVGDGSGTGLWLSNSHVKGCLIRNAGTGIVIAGSNVSFQPDDSTHAVPTEIRQCGIGVSINRYYGGEATELRNLLIRDCSSDGIAVYQVDGATVNYCTVVNCGTGVRYDPRFSPNLRVLDSILASNGTQVQISGGGFINYTDLWGPVGTNSGSYGSMVAVFDPGFVQPGTDYHLLTTSLFIDYSVSGGEIGAYGPGGGQGQPTTDVSSNVSALRALRVLPNPSRDGRLAVRFAADAGGIAQVRVLDLSGRVLRSRVIEVAPGQVQFDVASEPLPSGLYFVQVAHGGRIARARASVVR